MTLLGDLAPGTETGFPTGFPQGKFVKMPNFPWGKLCVGGAESEMSAEQEKVVD